MFALDYRNTSGTQFIDAQLHLLNQKQCVDDIKPLEDVKTRTFLQLIQ